MILVADVGGTKTDWRLIDGVEMGQFSSKGFNLSTGDFNDFIRNIPVEVKELEGLKEVHLYIAGIQQSGIIGGSDMRKLQEAFNTKRLFINGDHLAAARGLCLDQPGWVGIIGTGSNLCQYDGSQIVKRIPPLGFILGDEGSSVYMGKKLVRDVLRGKVPENISDSLSKRFNLSEQEVIGKVYKSGEARVFLSSFSRYLLQNSSDPYVYHLIYSSFEEYFDAFLIDNTPEVIHFTGSVAFFFSNILRQVSNDRGIRVGNITETPIAGLALYHKQQ